MKLYPGSSYQLSLFGPGEILDAVEDMARAGIEERGAVFTRPEVVNFILDLTGYTVDQPLHKLRASFGGGDFLLALASRLVASYRVHRGGDPVTDLSGAIRAVELHHQTFASTAARLEAVLSGDGLSHQEAGALTKAWLSQGDFLLADIGDDFDFVVGNPPYVRQEMIPEPLIAEYRRRYTTIFDRADIYIPFIESSLACLRRPLDEKSLRWPAAALHS